MIIKPAKPVESNTGKPFWDRVGSSKTSFSSILRIFPRITIPATSFRSYADFGVSELQTLN